jgi:hypothetical protein
MYGNVGARFIKWLIFQWCMPTSTIVDVPVLEWKYLVKGKSLRRAIFSLAFGVYIMGSLVSYRQDGVLGIFY